MLHQRDRLLGVILADTPERAENEQTEDAQFELDPRLRLDAVNEPARRLGVQPGQTVTEARIMASRLEVVVLRRSTVEVALGALAEALLAYGPTVSVQVPDTVWVDVSGSTRLRCGEEQLAEELFGVAAALGHRARVAIAGGPRISQAFARWGTGKPVQVIPGEITQQQMQKLPVVALPLEAELVAWFVRLGLLTVGDLGRLPAPAISARLGERATDILAFCRGEDNGPLRAYVSAPVLIESQEWEEPIEGLEPLLFVLRGLVARVSARLSGRGMAAKECQVVLGKEAAAARFLGQAPEVRIALQLAIPLWREDDLLRVLRAKLDHLRGVGRILGIRLEISKLTEAVGRQLDFSRVSNSLSGARGAEETLPILLTELSTDHGAENVGVLRLFDAHRPELRSALRPVGTRELACSPRDVGAPLRKARALTSSNLRPPTRLLPKPVPIDVPLRAGSLLPLGRTLYAIEQVEFEQRLESVEWWSKQPVSRDYVKLVLGSAGGQLAVLAYVDRETHARFVYAVLD